MIAALFIDERPGGAYVGLPGVDAWGESRDARLYVGPWPVVAHPPCGSWGGLRHMTQGRREIDASCMAPAVAAVRRFGGVLEQPALSRAFRTFGMPHPEEFPDAFGGRTIEVCQVEWGHPARKRTWLYVVGVCGDALRGLLAPMPGRQPTHWVSGGRNPNRKGSGGLVPPGIKVCSANQRIATPPAFRDALIALAQSCATKER